MTTGLPINRGNGRRFLNRTVLAVALAAVLGGSAAGTANAEGWHDHDRGPHREWHDEGPRGDYDRWHRWHYWEQRHHRPPPGVYYAPPPVVMAAPPPAYYAPPPLVMAPPPGVSIIVPLNFR